MLGRSRLVLSIVLAILSRVQPALAAAPAGHVAAPAGRAIAPAGTLTLGVPVTLVNRWLDPLVTPRARFVLTEPWPDRRALYDTSATGAGWIVPKTR